MLNQVRHSREPLSTTGYYELPLTAVKPEGWLRKQLERAAEGLTGTLYKFWPDVMDSAWRGGDGDPWERGPYYLDGLIPLAYLLDDEHLISVCGEFIEWILSSQREDGFFGPEDNGDWWPRMVALKALRQYYTATADRRVPEHMLKYFAYQLRQLDETPLTSWAVARAADNIDVVLWLYALTGRKFLLDLCEKLREQALDWTAHFHVFPHTRPMSKTIPWKSDMQPGMSGEALTGHDRPYYSTQYHLSHVVNVAMGLKYPGVLNKFRSNVKHIGGFAAGYQKLMKHHGVAYGMFTGDEHINGASPTQGTELCAVVELMYSLETLIDGCLPPEDLCDILEKLAYNALPAAMTADLSGHQYLQQANQVKVSVGKRPWYNNGDTANIYGLEPNFGCCTANLHQGWPKFAAHLWYGAPDGGFAAVSYAPCTVRFWSNDVPVRIEVGGSYPFSEAVSIDLAVASTVRFPLRLRIPAWAEGASATLPGGEIIAGTPGSFLVIDREWSGSAHIDLTLPMRPRVTTWYHSTAAVEVGPLLMALKPEEKWTKIVARDFVDDWAVDAASEWNWALADEDIEVKFRPEEVGPFGGTGAVKAYVNAAPVDDWGMDGENCAAPPISPPISRKLIRRVELVPYGDTGLRISQFPRGVIVDE